MSVSCIRQLIKYVQVKKAYVFVVVVWISYASWGIGCVVGDLSFRYSNGPKQNGKRSPAGLFFHIWLYVGQLSNLDRSRIEEFQAYKINGLGSFSTFLNEFL